MRLSNINPKIITAVAIIIPAVLLVVFIVSLLIPDRESYPSVSSTSPQDGDEGVILSQPIVIYFQEELDSSQQANISFKIQPTIELPQEWTAADTLELTSAQLPESATTYTVIVSYKNEEIHSFSFETTTKTKEQIVEEGRQQAEDDFLFAQSEKEFYETYPWYSKLPIETDDYVIVYNFEKKAFRIRLLTLGEDALGAEIEATKNRALDSLEAIGVDLNKYDYYILTE